MLLQLLQIQGCLESLSKCKFKNTPLKPGVWGGAQCSACFVSTSGYCDTSGPPIALEHRLAWVVRGESRGRIIRWG